MTPMTTERQKNHNDAPGNIKELLTKEIMELTENECAELLVFMKTHIDS